MALRKAKRPRKDKYVDALDPYKLILGQFEMVKRVEKLLEKVKEDERLAHIPICVFDQIELCLDDICKIALVERESSSPK